MDHLNMEKKSEGWMGTDLGTELTYFLGEGNFMKSICKF